MIFNRRNKINSGALLLVSPLVFIAIAGSCAQDETDSQELSLIWEAWDVTNSTYVDTSDLDLEQVVGGMITGMLDAGKKPAYPFLAQLANVTGRPPKDVPDGLADVWWAWELYEAKWDDLDPGVLANSAIGGMVAMLDDSSVEYLSPAEYQEARRQQEEFYEGIGAFVANQEDKLVLSPMQGGPAARVSLRTGDVILEVDGEPMADKSLQEVVDLVRGLAGSRVTFLIEREGDPEPQEFNVVRDDIFTASASPGLLPGAVGYIYISDFQEDTSEEILDILENFDEVETLALILDLRFNRDGTIDSVQKVASEFLSEGLLMYDLDDGDRRKDWEIVGGGDAIEDLPMVVIVNEGTAMAAEVLAGAPQDAERAVIIGDRTSGEGSESVFKELSDGSALKLPISRCGIHHLERASKIGESSPIPWCLLQMKTEYQVSIPSCPKLMSTWTISCPCLDRGQRRAGRSMPGRLRPGFPQPELLLPALHGS